MLVIIISSLLNLIYFFRVIENVYMSGEGGAVVKRSKGGLELPLSMLIPIVVLGVGVLVLGLTNEQIVTRVLQNALLGGGF